MDFQFFSGHPVYTRYEQTLFTLLAIVKNQKRDHVKIIVIFFHL